MRRLTVHATLLLSLVLAACQTLPAPEPAPQAQAAPPALRLNVLFDDDMVLQRDLSAPIWGWAAAGASVRVTRDAEAPVETTADADGKWMVRLTPLSAGGPHEITITSGTESRTLVNVMMGDVWICSGQSNMQWPMYANTGVSSMYVRNSIAEITKANYPDIRLYIVPRVKNTLPLDEVPQPEKPMYLDSSFEKERNWMPCTPENLPPFSAVGYFFGRAIHRDEKVPVGLIQTAWGGTPVESWISAEALETHPDYTGISAKLQHPEDNKILLTPEEHERAVAVWQESAASQDAGVVEGQPLWHAVELEDAAWPEMKLPGEWETQGLSDVDGYVWFRKTIQLPETWNDKPAMLILPPVNDKNQTWFNGVKISEFAEQSGADVPRKYSIPRGLVKAGANVVVLRVYDMGDQGGVAPGAMQLLGGALCQEAVSIEGAWKYQVGLDLKTAQKRPEPARMLGDRGQDPAVLYNAMIAPLIPVGVKGAIWYQGESNASRAYQYRSLFPLMITDWRTRWGQGDFPFLFVQLANLGERKEQPADDDWAELREAQVMTLSLPNTGMAVTMDIGEANDIHPRNKQDVGERLGLAARHAAYGETLVYSGPVYRSMAVEKDRVRLQFDHVGDGLVAPGGQPAGFEIAGADKKFVWAEARIEDGTIVVWSPEVAHPVAVRYAWAQNPYCNVFNKEGLPASPFRTDDWPGKTVGKR